MAEPEVAGPATHGEAGGPAMPVRLPRRPGEGPARGDPALARQVERRLSLARIYYKVLVETSTDKYYLTSLSRPEVSFNKETGEATEVKADWIDFNDNGWFPEYFDWSTIKVLVWQRVPMEQGPNAFVYDKDKPLDVLDDTDTFKQVSEPTRKGGKPSGILDF